MSRVGLVLKGIDWGDVELIVGLIKAKLLVNKLQICPFLLLVNKRDLLALYLIGTYCHKTGTRPPSWQLLENQLSMNYLREKHLLINCGPYWILGPN